MSTSLITNLDAATGPTTSGVLTNATDSAPNTMGCNIVGSDSLSGFLIAGNFFQTVVQSSGGYQCVMTVDWAGLLVSIPADAEISRVEITAAVNYNVLANSSYTRTAGSDIVNGTANADVSVAIGGGGAFTPTINTLVNASQDLTGFATVGSYNLSAQVTASPNITKDYVFSPAGSNPDAPAGFISRGSLLSHFSSLSLSMVAIALCQVENTGISNGNYSLSSSVALQVSLFIMRVYWNRPGTTTFPMALPTISAAPTIRVGDDVTINDPTGNLHDVTDVFLTFEDGTTLDIPWSWIWVWTNYTITFTIPFEVGSYVGIIYISIISVHFGGSVLLGTLQVQYENATGIYKLDPNISNDVRYIRRYDNTPLSLRFLEDEEIQEYYFLRAPGITPLVIIPEPIGYMEAYIEDLSNEDIVPYSTLSVTVEQIKIPNPFASTAFIGG
jgi:hypothetical protein